MTTAHKLVLISLLLAMTSFTSAQSAPSAPSADTISPSAATSASPGSLTTPDADHDEDGAKASKDRSDDDKEKPLTADQVHNPVLWTDPGNVADHDLFYGQGGEKHQPKPPFRFLREDMHGTNPKFDARDADGRKWRVKLGEESRPEVVASRLLWAVGYFANDDYVLPEATVRGLKMHRKSVDAIGDRITDARFACKPGGQDKIGIWRWKDNPFTGTREFNGLRVMMALLNNWDLKDDNNAVYWDSKSGRQIFLADDVGASFGTNGLSWTRARSKGNVESYEKSKFITRVTDSEVDFATPAAPHAFLAKTGGFGVVPYEKRAGLDWIGKKIPRDDARWIASLLAQLTHQQLVDAFRAGDFPADEADVYVALIENRIAELKTL